MLARKVAGMLACWHESCWHEDKSVQTLLASIDHRMELAGLLASPLPSTCDHVRTDQESQESVTVLPGSIRKPASQPAGSSSPADHLKFVAQYRNNLDRAIGNLVVEEATVEESTV
jgi:hypothetical protein